MGRSLNLFGRGDLGLYGFVSPESYGLVGDLTLHPKKNLGIYASGRYYADKRWEALGGIKFTW